MTIEENRSTLCRMCDEHCALTIRLEHGKITAINGCERHPWNRGRICGKAPAALALSQHRDRILKPLKKVDGQWKEIELGQALDEIAAKLAGFRDRFGARSVGVWKGEALGFAQEADLYRRFIHAFGSPNYFSNDSACYIGRYMGYRLGFGLCGVPDYRNSRCIVLWGGNPPASHPNTGQIILQAKKAGAKLIVVDPRRSTMAELADLHLPIKPGTDGCLALGIARILIEEGWYDSEFIAGYCTGFEKFAAHVGKFSQEYVEQETGLPTGIVRQMAGMLNDSAPHVAIGMGNGPEHHTGGVQGIRAIALLDALLGSFDRPGGNRWAEDPGLNQLPLHEDKSLQQLNPIGAEEFPLLYEFRQECNTMRLMDTLINERPYPIKGLILAGANPLLTNPHSKKVREALSRLDLFVVRELFMTPTAELAHYVLPAATFLERSELHCHAALQIINLTHRISSIPGVLDEYQFLRELACRLKMENYFPWQDENELNRYLLEPTGIDAADLHSHVEGIQYAPILYEKWRNRKLPTPSGKVEFLSPYLNEMGLPELPEYLPPEYLSPDTGREYPYVLISGVRKTLNAYGRSFANGTPQPYQEVEMHPADAARLGLEEGSPVLITSRVGSIKLKVKILTTGGIVPGCLSATHGWPDSCINDLTPDDGLDPFDGFPVLKSVPVRIVKL